MNKYFCKIFLCLFISILFFEIFFKVFCFDVFDISLIRITLFTMTTSALLSFIYSLFKPLVAKILIIISLLVMSIYTFIQIAFKDFMGNFMSFNMLSGGDVNRVSGEVSTFFQDINPLSYLIFLPIFILIIVFIFTKIKYIRNTKKNVLITLSLIIILHGLSLGTLFIKFFDSSVKTSKDLYFNPSLVDDSLKLFGPTRFMVRDLVAIFNTKEQEIEVIKPNPVDPVKPDYKRVIDDTDWVNIMNSTTDKSISNLHEYYYNKNVTPKNEYTGVFKDKNLVMIMVEAFDMVAINKDLTPTLYKLKEEGWYFDNYYAPKFSCTTGESEYIALTSIIPSNTVCTPFTYIDNNYSTSIFNLFNNSNYKSTSYHSWDDQYYPRKKLHKNMGSSNFYNNDDLKVKNNYGWPSDVDLMKKAYDIFSKDEKYFSFMITASMHFTYDRDSKVVLENWDKVKNLDTTTPMKRYLAKAIDFDKSISYLLETLEASNKLDDTVIVLFGDHHPYNLDFEVINSLSSINRHEDFNEDRMPMIIYNHEQESKKITKASSTFDLVPTLANLFDLNYDPRYYTGTDLFSDEESIVLFPNGSFMTDKMLYFSNKNDYKLLQDVDDNYIDNLKKIVSNKFTASENTLKKDYFKYRFK